MHMPGENENGSVNKVKEFRRVFGGIYYVHAKKFTSERKNEGGGRLFRCSEKG